MLKKYTFFTLILLILTLFLLFFTTCAVPEGGSSGGGGGSNPSPTQYTLTINVIGNGTVTPSGGTYNAGTIVNLTATADTTNDVFVQWRGDLKSVDSSEQLTMNCNKTIEAYFVDSATPKVSLTINTSGSSSVVKFPDDAGSGYYVGTIVSLTPVPASGKKFTIWSDDLSGAANPANITMSGARNVTANFVDLIWNIMIYMASDNDLEPYAISDINELENVSGIDESNINVFVLVDRINGYSTDDGDWKGTRLYQIIYDSITTDNNIRSNRLAGMGLDDTGDTDELNMADPDNLTDFVEFVKSNYIADNNMLILWNHGNGWRNKTTYTSDVKVAKSDITDLIKENLTIYKTSKDKKTYLPIKISDQKISVDNFISESNDPTKSICQDVTSSNDILNISEVRVALTGEGLTVLGFDACLMGMIEVIYEFKDLAIYMIASPESIPADGWDYDGWLTSFLSTGLDVDDLYTTAIDAYAIYYNANQLACLAAYNLSLVSDLYSDYNNFATKLNDYLWNEEHSNKSDNIFNTIINNTEQYVTPVAGGNFHIDIYDLADNFSSITGYPTLNATASELMKTVDDIVVYNWTKGGGDIFSGNPQSHGIAVYFGTLDGSFNIGLLNDYAVNDYTLFTTNSTWPDFLLDLYQFPSESSGTWAYATTYDGFDITEGSSKYYFIYVDGSGTVSATLSNYGSNDLDLYLVNYNTGAILDYSWYGDPTENISYYFSSSQEGWYFIVVNHYEGSTTDYSLAINGANIK